jgi:hypothetical protein
MAGNVQPIFPDAPKVNGGSLTAANVAKDGTGTVVTLFTAGVDGAFIQEVHAIPLGTNTASVLRLFLNNGSDPTVATNNILWRELSLPASSASEVAEKTPASLTINRAIPAGYRITATIGTTVAAGWTVSVLGGDY